jgi:D-2-hydroxyacid dehydrogenase (NADP+)
MIAVITNDRFLKVANIEEAFPKILEKGEEWKIYPNFDAMLADKDKIEIIFNSSKIDGEKIKEFKNLKWIFSYSAGVDSYPLEALKEMGVVLTNTRGVHGKSISEQVFGAMIMFSRNLITAFRNQEKRIYDQSIEISELTGKNLLIIGMGAIGKEIARKAKAFDMHVTGIRNHANKDLPENFDEAFATSELDKHLKDKDYIISILPSTKETTELFDKSKFDLMDSKTIFINVGRGNLIVEEDLVDALKSKKIKGAYLDVYPTEPLPKESELWDLDNIIMTPHNAGPTPLYFERSIKIFEKNYKLYKNGEDLINKINYDLKY